MHQPIPHPSQSHRRSFVHITSSITSLQAKNKPKTKYKLVTTKKEKTSNMHKQYTLHNRQVQKKYNKYGKQQVQV